MNLVYLPSNAFDCNLFLLLKLMVRYQLYARPIEFLTRSVSFYAGLLG